VNEKRLSELLERFPHLHVLVVGDFFLDKYLVMDRRLSEVSLETGLEAYQVVGVRCSPGAAGTVTSNLRALDVNVVALGVIGDDGEGYELKRGLLERGVDIAPLIQRSDLFTLTYTKPLMREPDGHEHEIQRLDIKNRRPLLAEVEKGIIARLRALVPEVDAVVVADQVQEHNCGVITDRVRDEIVALARAYPNKVFAADSRERIGLFRDVIIKPNRREATLAVRPDWGSEFTLEVARECGAELFRRNRKPVFLTIGGDGILLFDSRGCEHVPAVPVSGPIDIVGAGDSVMAGVVSALCAGAEACQAALVGNLVASITIQQIGTTGTASRQQVLDRFREFLRSHAGP
jgi:rfaE bifunctional protein kinase chain/domain